MVRSAKTMIGWVNERPCTRTAFSGPLISWRTTRSEVAMLLSRWRAVT